MLRYSRISPGEKMKDTVDIGGVTVMPHLQFKINIFFHSIDSEGQGRPVGKMIDNGVDAG